MLAAYFGWAQSTIMRPAGRPPNTTEQRLLSGAYGLVDSFHPHYNVSMVTTNQTLGDTNSIVLVRNPVAHLNHINLPNPTNFPGRWFQITTFGVVNTAVLTNSDGGTFEGATNITAASYTMSSNTTVIAVSTGTNYVVLRLATGNN